jgi:hypothetical protein
MSLDIDRDACLYCTPGAWCFIGLNFDTLKMLAWLLVLFSFAYLTYLTLVSLVRKRVLTELCIGERRTWVEKGVEG